MRKKPIIFCDFDGTFTEKDIGHNFYRHFSNDKIGPIVHDWKKGLISSRECLRREAALVHADESRVTAFLARYDLRAGAVDFYRALKKNDLDFYIVSDGLNLYIEYFLARHKLEEIRFFSNIGTLRNGGLTIEFPHDNHGCRRCGCCKGARIAEITEKNRSAVTVVFIGDGLSDLCALPHADMIFARGDLLRYCREQNVMAIEYESFYDILKKLNDAGLMTG